LAYNVREKATHYEYGFDTSSGIAIREI